jgi:hypothetical protein
LSAALSLLLGCATAGPTMVAPPPPPHVVQSMGYNEAVQLGSVYAQELGYANPRLVDASPVGSNLWRVRFGLERKDGGRHLILELDGQTKKLVKSEELSGLGGKFVPPASP